MEPSAIAMDRETALALERALRGVLGVDTLQRLQAGFSQLGGIAVAICAMDGALITEPTWPDEFHRLLASSDAARQTLARRTRTLAADPSARAEALCHPEAELIVHPVRHDGQMLAVVICETRPTAALSPARLAALARSHAIDPRRLGDAYAQVRPWTAADGQNARPRADLLADTVESLYGLAARIRRQLADLQTVYEIGSLLSGTRGLQEILDRAVKKVVDVMGVKACGIRLLDAETGELRIKAVCNLSPEYLQKGPVRVGDSSIDAAALAGASVYIEDAPNDARTRYPESMRREGIVSGLCVPMTYRGATVGLIRVYTDRRHVFSASEEQLVRSIGSQTAAAVINSRLFAARTEAEHFQRQVRYAGEIQRRMMPASTPVHTEVEFGAVYRPTLDLGGDFYDFLQLNDGSVGVCVSDVVGKGLPAALMMASIRSALRAHAHNIGDVNETVVAVNQHMCRDAKVSEFASLAYAVISPDGRQLRYCNAGHLPPLLLRAEKFTELTTGGLVIGVEPGESYEAAAMKLRAGDILVFVTDGVTEALNFHDEAYGMDRVRKSVHRHRQLPAQRLAEQILWDVRRFVGLVDQSDDITIVAAKVRRAGETG